MPKTTNLNSNSKTMKYLNSNTVVILLFASVLFLAFSPAKTEKTNSLDYMTVTTVESIIPGGLGRSRMLISESNGKTQEEKIQNLYSIGGISMKNITSNDVDVTSKLAELSAEGWELFSTNTGVQSPSTGTNQGIFLTRYLLVRAK